MIACVDVETRTSESFAKETAGEDKTWRATTSAAVWRMQTWLQAGIGDSGRTLVPHTHREASSDVLVGLPNTMTAVTQRLLETHKNGR